MGPPSGRVVQAHLALVAPLNVSFGEARYIREKPLTLEA
jgi:hypothetical protein